MKAPVDILSGKNIDSADDVFRFRERVYLPIWQMVSDRSLYNSRNRSRNSLEFRNIFLNRLNMVCVKLHY